MRWANRSFRRGRTTSGHARVVAAAIGAVVALGAATVVAAPAHATTTQVIAAGTSATNLPTETAWPGAQNPPYICCWGTQGQFVRFSFTVASGTSTLTLRYSAGNGPATREIEIDGAVHAANQTFAATPNWSTWTTLTFPISFTAGTHTLEILWDNAAGSSQYLNLDNLAVTHATTPPVPVNTARPLITGTPQQGQTLSASTGTWTNSPTSFTYRWNRCKPTCAAIAATAKTYTLAAADVGATMTVAVTAANAGGSGAAATSVPTAVVTASSGGGTQVIPAGTSSTNLPTETVWPGAQDPPYICCWGTQGHFVTFAFTTAAGPTNLALRYSAGNGPASRKIELDGSVLVANETFPATANWSTWTTLALQPTLTAGSHTLKVWFDATAGSNQFVNLDNLTVSASAPPPTGLVVDVGYADSATGLTPWSGSANTTFIGELAQCCSTHGPDNGSNGYDAGAIEVTNNGSASVTVNAVTADFGGGSSPSHFDIWGANVTPHLPQTLAPGGHLVLTMTSSFNFDTSDLFGEACHINSGVVPVVHVTVNGTLTDYLDSHQVLTSDGADLASCPGDISEQTPFTVVQPGAQPPATAVNEIAPAVVAAGPASAPGTATVGRVLSGFAGGWNASPPPALSLQWTRCDTSGNSCADIAGATAAKYVATASDAGSTLRLKVTASNASGSVSKSSAPTSVVKSGPAVAQLGHTVTGFTSSFVNNTAEISWPETATAAGTTNDFAFFARGAGNDQVFTPRIYSAGGSLLATGAAATVPKGHDGTWYVSNLSGLHLTAGTQYRFALDPSGSFNGTYLGGETNGEPSFFVDYAP
jgi:hypothetical protein